MGLSEALKSFGTTTLGNVTKYSLFNGQSQLFDKDLFLNAQQKFRFVALIDDIPTAYISQIDRPSYTVDTQEHILLDHVVRYPIRIKWDPISFTIKEIYGGKTVGSVGSNLMAKLLANSYYYPDNVSTSQDLGVLTSIINPINNAREAAFGTKNLSKQNLNGALGLLKIVSLKPDGSIFETWTIYNGMITSVKFSNNSYSEEGLTDVTVTVNYDWAKLQLGST